MSFWTNDNVKYIREALHDGRQTAPSREGTFIINTSGAHGVSGVHGKGETKRTYATSAENGESGRNADDIQILIAAPTSGDSFWVSQGTPGSVTSHPLYSASTSIKLIARGGNGGNGGKGGDGMDGKAGSDGWDATEYRSGTNGGNGSPGGNGGSGGHGGRGGSGGNITINVQREHVDLLLCVDQTDPSGGSGGHGGKGGTGGTGGRGGYGGSSYTWTETTHNSDGSTSSVTRSNSGGSNGRKGADGRNGTNGSSGTAGVSGKYTIRVHDMDSASTTSYSSIYDMYVVQTGIVDASKTGGIVEPGQVVPLTNIVIGNKGGMPSPARTNPSGKQDHGICVGLVNTSLVTMIPASAVILRTAIPTNHQCNLGSDLQCKIHRISPMLAPNSPPLQYDVTLQLTAHSTRLMRLLPSFARAPVQVTVRYPLEIEAVKGGRTGLAGDHIPFAVCVKNIASIGLGVDAARPRLVRVKVEVLNVEDMNDKSKLVFNTCTPVTSATQAYNLGNGPVYFDIPVIADKKYEAMTGSLVCKPGCVAPYTAITIQVTLQLGDIDNPLILSESSDIQRVTHSFHTVEECGVFPVYACAEAVTASEKSEKGDTVGFDSDADAVPDNAEKAASAPPAPPAPPAPIAPTFSGGNNLLLVVNGSTTSAEIKHWRTFAAALQMSIVCYDVAYYNGFGYCMETVNILEQMQGGLVVILNDAYYRNDDPAYQNNGFYANQFLRTSTIFEAARRCSIRTYVINDNGGLDMRQLAYPSEGFSEYVQHTSRSAFADATSKEPFAQTSECLAPVHDLVTVSTKCVFFSPSEEKFVAKTEGLGDKLAKARPDRTYFTIPQYDKEKLSTSFLFVSKYRAGVVQCRRGLDNTNALIGMWDLKVGNNALPRDHYFAAVKLLPYEKKLSLLCMPDMHCHILVGAILVDAVLSDIADEVSLFVLHKRDYLLTGIPSKQLPTCMLKLETFVSHAFPDFLTPKLLIMTKRLETLFLRLRTKWGMGHPYARYLLEALYGMVSRLVPESLSSKMNAAKFLTESIEVNSSEPKRGVRFSLMAMRDPYGLISSGALSFNNSAALANDPPIAAVDGMPGAGRPMFKFNTEKERMLGVADFAKKAGIISTNGGKVIHSGCV